MNSNYMYCKHCGAENKDKAKFCRKCGMSLGEKQENSEEIPPSALVSGAKYRYGKVVIIFVAVFIIAAIFVVKREYDKYQDRKYEKFVVQADTYIKDKEYDKAVNACKDALKIKSTDADIYIKLGESYNGMQDTENALENYYKALEKGAVSKEVYDGLVKIYYKGMMWNELLDVCDSAIESLDSGQEHYKNIKKFYESYERERALQEIFNNQRGKASGCKYDGSRVQAFGLCFAEMIDFEGSGEEKLVLAYTADTYDIDYLPGSIDDYVLEVWDYAEGKAQKVFEGQPCYGPSNEREVVLLNTDNQWYLKAGDTGTGKEDVYYGFKDGEFMQSDIQNIAGGDVKTYVLQGYYAGVDRSEAELAYNTANNSEQKLSHVIESYWYGLKNTIVDEKDGMASIENGSYSYESTDLNMYACAYINEEGNAEISLKYNWLDGTYSSGQNLIFQYNKEKRVYEEKNVSDAKNGAFSIEQNDDKINIALTTELAKKTLMAELIRETKYDN